MEKIIKKSIEGGYNRIIPKDSTYKYENYSYGLLTFKNKYGEAYQESICIHLMNSLFWQALGNECGWHKVSFNVVRETIGEKKTIGQEVDYRWKRVALRFHEINLTEGWQSAVDYLRSACGIEK